MDSINSTSVSRNILSSKMDIPTTCEPRIQLTKMDVVGNQNDINLENSNQQHIVEAQYINIHRMPDSIPPELLSHHVVDLGPNSEYSQHLVTSAQFYDNTDFISQHFSDEARRLALVAVQFMQPNRNNGPNNNNLNGDVLNDKTNLTSVGPLSTEKGVMPSIVKNYVQTVNPTVSENQANISLHITPNHTQVSEQYTNKKSQEHNDHIIKLYQPSLQDNKLQILSSSEKIDQPLSRNEKCNISDGNNCNSQSILVNSDLNSIPQMTHQITDSLTNIKTEDISEGLSSNISESVPTEDNEADRDNEAHSSQKSLPHKKRIPCKLKKALISPSTKNIDTKCYKCMKCGEQFPTQATFTVHKMQHFSKKVPYACELCNKTCLNQLKFFEHLKSHYEPRIKSDDSKINSFQTVEPHQLNQNINVQSQENNEDNQHLSESQNNSLYSAEHKIFNCSKCGRVFRRQKAFDCHMSISHPKKEEIEEFSDPEDMMEGIRHVVNMVPGVDEEDKNFEPWQASKNIENTVIPQQSSQNNIASSANIKHLPSFNEKTSQIKSESNNFFDEELSLVKTRKEMKCPHCERTFVHRNSLLYHIRSHTGHRPHQCELCGKSFFASGALKIHLRLHSGDRPYKCEYCGRFFRQWGDLKYHITSLHSNTKMFQCEYCGKDFARKYSLVVHRRIHTGEKNYICEYCTKTFRAASYLQNHRRIHTGEKPHMCQVCGKPFRVRSDMKRHMKTHPDVNVNALTKSSNKSSENNNQEMSCLINNHQMTIEKQENTENTTVSNQNTDQNIKHVVSESESSINLNVRPSSMQEGLFSYQRDVNDDRENANTNTLYVWIQTGSNSILPDT